MTIHRTFLNHKETGPNLEVNTLPSETVPDMTLSLQELLERHTQGRSVPEFRGNYENEDDDFIPNPHSLDMTELTDLAYAQAQKVEQLQQKLQKQPKTKVVVEGAPSEPENPTPPAAGDPH